MMKKSQRNGIGRSAGLVSAGLLLWASVYPAAAAIALDRTRAVFPGAEKSIALNIANESSRKPYLAQAWLEDAQGKKITSPLMVTPAVQRLEPKQKSVIRVNALPEAASLPQDRESLFYFVVREIPPKSERPNVMQLALQTRIKLFYRPKAIMPERYSRQDDKLILHRVAGGYRVENPTPYYMTVLGVSGGPGLPVAKEFEAITLAPRSSETVRSGTYTAPYVTTVNDFGGRPGLTFRCQGDVCRAIVPAQ